MWVEWWFRAWRNLSIVGLRKNELWGSISQNWPSTFYLDLGWAYKNYQYLESSLTDFEAKVMHRFRDILYRNVGGHGGFRSRRHLNIVGLRKNELWGSISQNWPNTFDLDFRWAYINTLSPLQLILKQTLCTVFEIFFIEMWVEWSFRAWRNLSIVGLQKNELWGSISQNWPSTFDLDFRWAYISTLSPV